jgi:hypothetical protein
LIATAMSATERGCVATGRDALMGESCQGILLDDSTFINAPCRVRTK